jgi:hypothetical protein
MIDIKGNVAPREMVVLRDATGQPLINGSMETFKASAHSVQKATYEDRNLSITLPNPIPANAAGVLSDSPSGAPKPVYYADDENYYLVIRDSSGAIVMTVDDWNADNAFSTQPQIDEIVTTNFIPNAQFRSLVNFKTLYSSDDLNAANNILVARNDWYLRRDVLTSTNTLEFKEFIVGQTDVPFNPKYYINFACSVISTETIKDITVDIGNVETFSNQEMTFSIYAKSSTLSQIEILTDQDFGSGGSAQVLTSVDSFQLTNSWSQYSTTFIVADVTGKTVGTDDKFRIRVRVPLNAICNIDFVMCQLNLGDTILEFDYKPSIDNGGNASKDAIPQPEKSDALKSLTIASDGITNEWISNPPIGSTIGFAGDTAPDGYLMCDNSSYSGIVETIYANLYDVIKNKYGFGDNGFYPIANSNQLNVTNTKKDTNVTDIADGTTGFTFIVERQGGDVGFITERAFDLSAKVISNLPQNALRVENKNVGAVTAASAQTSGFTITVEQSGTAILEEITRITPTAASGLAGKYFFISSATTNYYVWFEVSGSGADPAIGGRTGIKVVVNTTDTLLQVYGSLFYALGGCEQDKILTVAASSLTAGDYFQIHNSTTTFIPWYKIAGAGTEPVVSGTKFSIDLDGTETDAQVATKTRDALARIRFQTPKYSGYFMRVWNNGSHIDQDAATRYPTLGFDANGDNVGTLQIDEFKSHTHEGTVLRGGGSSAFDSGTTGENPVGTIGGNETRPINVYEMRIIKY